MPCSSQALALNLRTHLLDQIRPTTCLGRRHNDGGLLSIYCMRSAANISAPIVLTALLLTQAVPTRIYSARVVLAASDNDALPLHPVPALWLKISYALARLFTKIISTSRTWMSKPGTQHFHRFRGPSVLQPAIMFDLTSSMSSQFLVRRLGRLPS